jgi:hypothetical protein
MAVLSAIGGVFISAAEAESFGEFIFGCIAGFFTMIFTLSLIIAILAFFVLTFKFLGSL